MKKIVTSFMVLAAMSAFAQVPAGYYNSATGTGYTLKTQLHNIINAHTDTSYGGLYITFPLSDIDKYYENDGSLLDIYSEKPAGADSYEYYYGTSSQDDGSGGTAEGQKFNREHGVPQSYFASALPMYSDAHFIIPTDKYVNEQRGNLPYGKVGATATYTSSNGTKKGNALNSGYAAGYSGVVFEPIDEFKGDVARMYFYFVTCYESQIAGFYTAANATSTQAKAMFDGTANHSFSPAFLNILLTWNAQDPVSQRELDRNNAIYGRQNNRNPFIDHPEYATTIWGTVAGVNTTVATPLSVYPNPAVNNEVHVYSEAALTEVQVVNLNGQLVQYVKNPANTGNTYTINNLPAGLYLLKITAGSQVTTKKILVK